MCSTLWIDGVCSAASSFELAVTETSWGRVIPLGALQHGAIRSVIVPMVVAACGSAEPFLKATLAFEPAGGHRPLSTVVSELRPSSAVLVASLRSQLIDMGHQAIRQAHGRQQAAALESIAVLVDSIDSSIRGVDLGAADGARIATLRADVAGRMSKALTGEVRFKRWGRHYLRALIRAHQLEVCCIRSLPSRST